MRNFSFLALTTTFILSAFAQNIVPTNNTKVPFEEGVDLFAYKAIVTKDNHNGFTLEYKNYYKVLTNLITNKKYCLVGWERPIPSECTGETSYSTPIKALGVDADSYSAIPFIELLGLQDKLYVVSNQNITSPCITDSTKNTVPITPDIVFSQDPTRPHVSFSGDDDSLAPLQKVSWLLYIAAFFDLELDAQMVMQQINTNYICHRDNIGAGQRKTVSWTYYDPATHIFTIRGGEYFTQLVSDAGGSLQVPNRLQNSTFANNAVDLHLLAKDIQGSEFIIDESDPSLQYDTWLKAGGDFFSVNSSFAHVNAIANNKVYTINGLIKDNSTLSDWSQRSAARPDLALLDLIKLFYPSFTIAGQASFPVWLTPFPTMDSTRRTISQGNYDSCANVFASVKSQTACVIGGGNANTQYKQDLSSGDKAGISVGAVLFVIVAALAGIYFYRKYRRNQRHNFYRMNDL